MSAAFVAALGTAAAVLVARAPLDGVDARVLAELGAGSGLRFEANGRVTISYLPRPEIRIDGVSIARGDAPPFVAARELVAVPRLLPLLAGRVEVEQVTLKTADVTLDAAPTRELFAALGSAAGSAPPSLRIADGRLTFGGRTIDKVEAGLVWPAAARPLAISGFGRFSGRPVEAAFSLADPAALAGGEASPFRARLAGGGAQIVFDGTARDADDPRFSGALRARAAALHDTLAWLGAPPPRSGASLGGASLAGQATADASGFAISGAELEIHGESLFGAGRVTAVDDRLSVEATLDADRLNLKPYLRSLAPELRRGGDWSRETLDLRALAGFDLDLRVSARAVEVGRISLGPSAATVTVAHGALDVAIGEASAYGGVVGGRISLEPHDGGAKLTLQGAMTDVALDEALESGARRPPLAGALTADLALEGAGASIAAIVADLDGLGSVSVANGSIGGLGGSRALALAGFRGRMPVASAKARITVRDGVARTDDLAIQGEEGDISLSGEARLADRELRLHGFAKPANAGWTLPVKVDGPFAAPRLRPDLATRAPTGEARRGSPDAPAN